VRGQAVDIQCHIMYLFHLFSLSNKAQEKRVKAIVKYLMYIHVLTNKTHSSVTKASFNEIIICGTYTVLNQTNINKLNTSYH